ncbi:MAG: M23 family metallopeptidase [Myxococcales bacterium]|nr:M23 family metallopeptidase [Myxococcales bacterium]
MTSLGICLLLAVATSPFEVRLSPPEPLQGQLLLIDIPEARPSDRLSGTFDGSPIHPFWDARGRLRALAVVKLQRPAGKASLTLRLARENEPPRIRNLAVRVRAGTFPEQTLTVDPKFLAPPKQAWPKIAADQKAMDQVFSAPDSEKKWRGRFVWPSDGRRGGGFGIRRTFNKTQRSRHWGIDISGEEGDPVAAIGAGVVVLKRDCYYSGGTLVVDHGAGLYSLYFHLSKYEVGEGDAVTQGQLIGRVGATGRVTGSHLHISTKLGKIPFDPQSLIEADLSEDEVPASPPATPAPASGPTPASEPAAEPTVR